MNVEKFIWTSYQSNIFQDSVFEKFPLVGTLWKRNNFLSLYYMTSHNMNLLVMNWHMHNAQRFCHSLQDKFLKIEICNISFRGSSMHNYMSQRYPEYKFLNYVITLKTDINWKLYDLIISVLVFFYLRDTWKLFWLQKGILKT